MDLSVILPVLDDYENLRILLPRLRVFLEQQHLTYELIVVDGGSSDGSGESSLSMGARVVTRRGRGYAERLLAGFEEASGDYCLTLETDMSHDPEFITKLWRARHRADIIIASRYVRGGVAYTSWARRMLSRANNRIIGRILSIPVRDLSSGFRLYRRDALNELHLESRGLAALGEILVRGYARGLVIAEVPFTYIPRSRAGLNSRSVHFAIDLWRASGRLWRLRNSLESADYDERAYYSIVPIQRFWQRRRHHIITAWARGAGRTLDVGCGSSVVIQSLNDAIGMDVSFAKVRFLRRYSVPVVRGSAFALPFRDEAFDCLISSQIIEHVPFDAAIFGEMRRVLRPGGRLIIGTPDYATIGWRIIEPLYGALMPGGYHDEHITHYTRRSLDKILASHGFVHEETAYVARSELIMRYHRGALRLSDQAATPLVARQGAS